ncbi:MAG: hypothetical protein ABIW82_16285 [Dokdonella sp.]
MSTAIYGYDAKGQKIDETVIYGSGQDSVSGTLRYAYQANGLKSKLTYPGGAEQISIYDKNRLASVNIKGNLIQYQDYVWGVSTKTTMPGAIRTTTYDPLQRPIEIAGISNGGAVLMDYSYAYDANGNITRKSTEDGDFIYQYDKLDRLISATPPVGLQQGPGNVDGLPVEQYTYDADHNRTTSAHQPGVWIYNEDNQLLGYGSGTNQQTFDYDRNGNAIAQKIGSPQSPAATRKYVYNASERMVEVRDNDATTAKYQYDPRGRRIKKETPAGVTWFLYADEGLIAEFTGAGLLKRTYGWKMGGAWGTDPEVSPQISHGQSKLFE